METSEQLERLRTQQCVPCQGGDARLDEQEIAGLHALLPAWRIAPVAGVARLERVYPLPDFASALALANAIGALAEQEGHHPTLLVEWGKLTVTWWTHAIGGLHRNDFIMAARSDALAAAGV